MKRILVTLTFALGLLTIGSAVVSNHSSNILDHTVLVSQDDPPPICPPICSNGSSDATTVLQTNLQ